MSEPWVLCADWLSRCGTLSDVQSLESVEHLASVLKDGVILCKTLNRLKANCIPSKSFSLRPQGSSFLSTMNIRTFLTYCKSDFKLTESQLFKVNDLLNMEKFGKVIYTLSKLSMTRYARAWKLEPFDAEENTDYIIMERAMEEAEEEYDSSLYVTGEEAFDENSEDIYDILITNQCPAEMPAPKSRKEFCIQELLTTEKNFLEVLDTINNLFMKRLKTLLKNEEFTTIFFKMDEVKQAHRNLYDGLKSAVSSSQPALEIARCFLDRHTSFVFYGELSSRMGVALEELERVCRENRVVSDAIKRGNEQAKVKLHDLLAVPIVRVLKYHLIIKELLKHCQGDEALEVKKALNAIEDLNLYINEVKRDFESMNTISKIQKSIVDLWKYFDISTSSLDCYGRRHFDGEFDVKRIKRGTRNVTWKPGYIFLFDKLLIICSPVKNEEYHYKASLAIITIQVNTAANEKGMNQIVLSSNDNSEEEKYFVSSKKTDNILKLFNYIELARGNCCPDGYNSNGHHFILTNFTEVVRCNVCSKLLRGKISQGYRCRNTNKILHKECMSKVGREDLPKIAISRPNPPQPPQPQAPERPPRRVIKVPPKSPRTSLEKEPWFSTLNRSCSNNILNDLPEGTFLVRYNEEKGNYSISLKHDTVKHLMIKQTENGDFYFTACQTFPSLRSLVEHYRFNSLQTIFHHISCCLGQPYSEVERSGPRMCKAICDFSPHDRGQLGFNKDDIIQILSTKDDVWWRGELRNKKGTFPSHYVEIL